MQQHPMDPHRTRASLFRSAVFCAVWATGSLVPSCGWAWNPFAAGPRFNEPELTAAEWRQVDQKAGWAADADTLLLVEIHNRLPGPLACHGVVVNMHSGADIKKAFSPYLYVPAGATKQTGVSGVKKGQMKGFSVRCNCWKRETDTRCIDPKNAPQ